MTTKKVEYRVELDDTDGYAYIFSSLSAVREYLQAKHGRPCKGITKITTVYEKIEQEDLV